jgi:hypothetical protein
MLISFLRKLSNWLKYNLPDLILILIILGIGIFVAFKNYVPGTWLLGWDSLVPELNFKLNIARSLSAVWQEYQGLGLLGGMAHAADLPRQIFLLISSLFLPTSFLRYFWTFLMLCIGPLGVYFLVGKNSARIPGFVSAVFYLFNLVTVQIFYTPFETFVCFYGFFPWLLYFALNYLKNGGKKRLLAFFVLSILSAGAFYVQTLFVVYVVFLSVFALEIIANKRMVGLFRSVSLGLVTFFANAFWLLPVLYFFLTSASIPANSHINSIATPETQLMNAARTGFTNMATLKGYWFDYFDWNKAGSYDYLYKIWIAYSNQSAVTLICLTLFVFSSLGLVLSLFKKKASFGVSFLILLVISGFMLNGGTIAWIPFFSEIFRNTFTKWSNVAALVYSVGLGYLIFIISDVFKNKNKYILSIFMAIVIVLGSIFTVWPILQGNLIADSMRLNLPSYYLDTINYFKDKDSTKRVVDFPLTDFWGWKFNDWGYRGSGFLWYGIRQPILDRAFDVWSPYNEAFYNEISHAVETINQDELRYVLNKYQVSYILFDGSIYEPGDNKPSLKIQREKDLLESSTFLSKARVFGKITVYRVNLEGASSFVSAPQADFSSQFIITGQKGNVVVNEAFPSTQGYQNAKNCDVKNRGSVTRDRTKMGNYYGAADDGVSCDYFYYPTLDPSQAYEMRITGKNINGRSLKFYLYNIKTKNIDVQELLPSGDFDKSYLILPTESSSLAGSGYTLNVETRSFGKEKSENLITGIEFYPVEYQKINGPVPIINNLVIGDVKKFGTWAYKVDVQGSGLMQLGQGFEKGWVAISNFHLLDHIKINDWANGWNIPTDTSTVYIFYWPQFLEWGGIVLGIGTIFCATISSKYG